MERLDPEKGFRFSTYATWWIRQALTRAVADKGRAIRLPVHLGERVRKVKNYALAHRVAHGEEPPVPVIAQALSLTQAQVELVLTVPTDPASLDAPPPRPIAGARSVPASLSEFVNDPSPTPEERAVETLSDATAMQALSRAFASLPPRQREVLAARYGLGDRKPETLQSLADRLGITREGVRQLQARAEEKLGRCRGLSRSG